MKLVAERAGIKTDTLSKVEKGSVTVSMGIYAKVLFVLGLVENIYENWIHNGQLSIFR